MHNYEFYNLPVAVLTTRSRASVPQTPSTGLRHPFSKKERCRKARPGVWHITFVSYNLHIAVLSLHGHVSNNIHVAVLTLQSRTWSRILQLTRCSSHSAESYIITYSTSYTWQFSLKSRTYPHILQLIRDAKSYIYIKSYIIKMYCTIYPVVIFIVQSFI